MVLPYRITDELVAMLKKHQPLWLNTHFNHPRELTSSAREALRKLADGGIPLGNQSVLLAGVNDCPRIMKSLVHKMVEKPGPALLSLPVRPVRGAVPFRTPVGKGIEIMESLIGHTSGFAVPTYVVDAPGGGGKIPLTPNYLISLSTNKVVLRNYEGSSPPIRSRKSMSPTFVTETVTTVICSEAGGCRRMSVDRDRKAACRLRHNDIPDANRYRTF